MSSAIFRPITSPVPVFLIIMGIMLIAPLLFERFKLPGIVGLILAGVVVGPHGLNLLQRDSTIILLGTVGLLFLMFMAGL
ncbi:MAG TPA: cation:proton antiporter, partial [Phormidium sp.]